MTRIEIWSLSLAASLVLGVLGSVIARQEGNQR